MTIEAVYLMIMYGFSTAVLDYQNRKLEYNVW